MDPLLGLTMREASDAIRSRQVSPIALVEAYLARIAAVDDQIGSYILVVAEAARGAAQAAEQEIAAGHWRGPLHGLPFGVKDNYFTKGIRTCVNSRVLLDHVPALDATVVTRLAEAGAILLGKLNTWEFGTTMGPVYHDLPYAHPRNPWDLTRFTGGSSTGAGAAVPARTALFAMGTDTGGSVRLPAAACGTQGLKTTAGLVSRYGIHPNCWALDVAGPLCWNVWDCAVILQAIAGFDAQDPSWVDGGAPAPDYCGGLSQGVAGLRVGYIADLDIDDAHPDPAILQNLAAAASVFEAAGAEIVPTRLPAPLIRYRRASAVINWSESYAIHEHDFREAGDKMGRALADKMMAGFSVRAVDLLAAQRERRLLTLATAPMIDAVDVVLMPGNFHVAAGLDDPARMTAYTAETAMTPFNLTGHPALSFCTGFDADGLPTSAQIVGRWFDEATVLRAGHAYEQATPWRDRFPVL